MFFSVVFTLPALISLKDYKNKTIKILNVSQYYIAITLEMENKRISLANTLKTFENPK